MVGPEFGDSMMASRASGEPLALLAVALALSRDLMANDPGAAGVRLDWGQFTSVRSITTQSGLRLGLLLFAPPPFLR
jgi:hypothetical protein